MRRKIKLIAFLIFVFVMAGALFYYYNRYEKIELPQEPDGIFSSPYTNKLAVIMDGKLTMYDETGRSRYIDTPFDISFAYPLEDSIYLIDVDGNLYEMIYKFYTEVPISDVILKDVKDFTCVYSYNDDLFSYGAVTSQGDLYVWGSNKYGNLGLKNTGYIEEPIKLEYVSNIEKVIFTYDVSMLLTKDGKVYEAGTVDKYNEITQETKCVYLQEFTEIENIENVIDISLGFYAKMFFYETGIEYQFYKHNYFKEEVQKCLDICESIQLIDVSQSIFFWVGITEEGQVYYWGRDVMNISNNPHFFAMEPVKVKWIKNAEAVYAGETVAYVKKGNELIILKDYNRLKLWGCK